MSVRNSTPLLSECQELCDAVQTHHALFSVQSLNLAKLFQSLCGAVFSCVASFTKAVKVEHTLAAVA